jgi:NADH dehydrogenase (ubiquinone) Fe-S protein 1
MTFFVNIDNQQVEINSNISILQACEIIDIIIPRFCYHERLSVAGNCRMCLVEIEKMPKLQASCAVSVLPNMVIKTNSLAVKKAREGILEFLLINHPLDCPICDQGGECDLQDQSLTYGGDRSRFKSFKRAIEDKNCGPLIKTIMTRCIHCTRCVRFVNEVVGIPDLGTSGRGNSIEIGSYVTKFFSSELSGNIIDLCPVGALTSKPYAFLSRPWELKSTESIDIFDCLHSNIRIDTRGYDILRILPRLNESINEEWISDKVRFSFDGLSVQRLTTPLLKDLSDGVFYPIKWSKAIKIIQDKINDSTPNSFAFSVGSFCDLESLTVLKRLSLNFGSVILNTSALDTDFSDNYKLNTFLENIRKSDVCLIVGVNPKTDGVLLNYHLRKGFLNSNLKVGYIGSSLNLSFPSLHLGVSLSTFISVLEGKNQFCKLLKRAKTPILIFGDSFLKEFSLFNLNLFRNLIAVNLEIYNKLWSSVNYFNLKSSDFSLFDISLQFKHRFVSNSFDLLYILEDYVPLDKGIKSKFIVFQGHHGCENAQKSDIILPCCSFAEKSCSFFNCEGRYQYSHGCLPSLSQSKESHLILSCFLPPHNNYEKFLYPSLEFSINKTYNNFFNDFFLFSVSLALYDNYVPSSSFDDFYKTDIISSLSLNMNRSSFQLLNKIPFKSLSN